MIHQVNDDTFANEALNSDQLVLVEFYAAGCILCKALTPILEEISQGYESRLKVVRVDIDECPKIVNDYRIKAYPTLIILKNGRITERIIGFSNDEEIKHLIEKII